MIIKFFFVFDDETKNLENNHVNSIWWYDKIYYVKLIGTKSSERQSNFYI